MIREQPRQPNGQYATRRFCLQHGHDTSVCGVDTRGFCRECARMYWRKHNRIRYRFKHRVVLPRLAEFRKIRGLTQGDLARLAGVHPRTVENVESGKLAQQRTRLKLADALGVDVRQLVADEDVEKVSKDWRAL